MTRVCLVGESEVDVRYELLSRETAREALATYSPGQPYENTLAVETVSLGAAVALLNDLDWYLTRFVDAALVREPSVDAEEWLSRDLATAVRNGDVDPAETGDRLMVYGVDDGRLVEPMYVRRGAPGPETDTDPAAGDADVPAPAQSDAVAPGTPGVERDPDAGAAAGDGDSNGDPDDDHGEAVDGDDPTDRRPDYDLREVDETLVVRVTEAEFAG